MKFGSGIPYGSRIRFGRSSNTHYLGTGIYYTFEIPSAWFEPVIEKPVPSELAWTKLNTSWDKKRGRK